VNCDFAQTFIINSMHWHGASVKISQMGNSCNSKNWVQKFRFFPIFSKTVWNFGIPSAPVYGDWGLYSWGYP